MDDLEFRRTLLAEPKNNSADILDAIAHDAKKMEFWNDLQKLNQNMTEASKIDIPDGLAQRLLLKQNMLAHNENRGAKRYLKYALAASVILAVSVSFMSWQHSQTISLSEHAIAHVEHEGDYALGANENISLQQVNAKLARFGGELTAQVGQVYYANFCDFNNVQSLHLVMQGDSGKVSVFIIPHKQTFKIDNLKEGIWNSQSVDFNRASLVVVSDHLSDVSEMKKKIASHIQFSA